MLYEVITGNSAMWGVEKSRNRAAKGRLTFETANNILYITLPSGRKLCYLRPRIGENRFGGKSLIYEGMDQTTKQWRKQETVITSYSIHYTKLYEAAALPPNCPGG